MLVIFLCVYLAARHPNHSIFLHPEVHLLEQVCSLNCMTWLIIAAIFLFFYAFMCYWCWFAFVCSSMVRYIGWQPILPSNHIIHGRHAYGLGVRQSRFSAQFPSQHWRDGTKAVIEVCLLSSSVQCRLSSGPQVNMCVLNNSN